MLGQKFARQAQALGNKISRRAQTLGTKANSVLKVADVGLRKAENTLKNKIIPASAIVAPELADIGLAGLGAVKALRSGVQSSRGTIDNIEKQGLRKVLEDQAKEDDPKSNFA